VGCANGNIQVFAMLGRALHGDIAKGGDLDRGITNLAQLCERRHQICFGLGVPSEGEHLHTKIDHANSLEWI
jgi:hypothetical protein